MYREKIIDVKSGEETWRDYTPEEIAQVQAAQAEAQAMAEAEAQAEAKRQVALAKLAALGLEEDDLKALGL
jgi:regulator of protease activity HflC (stomatin/prohibitin superfamily)